MAVRKQENGTVQIHGNVNKEILKAAAERFIKEALIYKQKTAKGLI